MEIDTNKEYKIKELCEMLGIPYNKKNPKLSLKKIECQFELEQISKQKYKIVRELSQEEKSEIRLYSDCKKLLETAIYITLSETQEYKNGIRGDIKDFFDKFHITNEYYKYFTYERLTEYKTDIIKKMTFGDDYDIATANLILHQFTEDVNPILRKVVLETFHKMENESYIFLNQYRMFGKVESLINESGERYTVSSKKEATFEDNEEYITIRREIMESMGFNEWDKVPFFTKGHIDKQICRRMGYNYSYYEYEIGLNQSGLKRKVEKENLTQVLTELNQSISHKLETSRQGNLKATKKSVKKDCIDGLIVNKEGRKE